MLSAVQELSERRARPLHVVGLLLAGALLVGIFVYRGFPYTELGQYLERRIQQERGIEVRFGAIGPHLGLAGPGIEATGVRAVLGDGQVLRLDRLVLRPAWSLSWIRGHPSLYTDVESAQGAAEGVLELGGGWSGRLSGVDLAALPLARALPGASLAGTLDAEVGSDGRVEIEARNGSLALPALPVALPFAKLSGEIAFGGEAFATIRELRIEGPLVAGSLKGTLGRAARPGDAPLALDVDLSVQPDLVQPLRANGLRIGRGGRTRIHIDGTLSAPHLR